MRIPLLLAALLFSPPAHAAEAGYSLLHLPEHGGPVVKWNSPEGELQLGEPAVITWALANAPLKTELPYGSCSSLLPMDLLLTRLKLPLNIFQREIEAGFFFWEKAANVRFERVTDPAKANLVIGLSEQDDPVLHARVSLDRAEPAGNGLAPLKKAALCLDFNELWTVSEQHTSKGEQNALSLRMTIAHEAGHVLGLNHVPDRSQLMQRGINGGTIGLGAGDLEGIQLLYGLPPSTQVRPLF